jgi:hypothetical protein
MASPKRHFQLGGGEREGEEGVSRVENYLIASLGSGRVQELRSTGEGEGRKEVQLLKKDGQGVRGIIDIFSIVSNASCR